MSFTLKLDTNADKFLKNLPKNIALRIITKLEKVCEDPFRFLEHFEGVFYKLRIGDYRALIDVDFERKILWVRVLDKRSRIY